jgi:hypothetical protein
MTYPAANSGEFLDADPGDFAFLMIRTNDFCLHLEYMYPEKADLGTVKRLLHLAQRGLKNND